MHSDFRFALLRDQYKGSNYWAVRSISSRTSRYINLKLTFSIVFVSILMFTFSNFQFVPHCKKLWHLKNHLFLLLHTAWISLAYPLSPLPLTCDTHVVFLQWNVSQCVQILIFNISNRDSFTKTIYLWYKYYPKWICVSFSFQYITYHLWAETLFIRGVYGKYLDKCNRMNIKYIRLMKFCINEYQLSNIKYYQHEKRIPING